MKKLITDRVQPEQWDHWDENPRPELEYNIEDFQDVHDGQPPGTLDPSTELHDVELVNYEYSGDSRDDSRS